MDIFDPWEAKVLRPNLLFRFGVKMCHCPRCICDVLLSSERLCCCQRGERC